MQEERRLMAVGFPPEDAAAMCWDLRRNGGLAEFVRRNEDAYRERLVAKNISACGGVRR